MHYNLNAKQKFPKVRWNQKKVESEPSPQYRDPVISANGIDAGGEKPILMDGPCSIKDYEHINVTAKIGIKNIYGLSRRVEKQ